MILLDGKVTSVEIDQLLIMKMKSKKKLFLKNQINKVLIDNGL